MNKNDRFKLNSHTYKLAMAAQNKEHVLPDPLNYAKILMTGISSEVTQAYRENFIAQSQAIANAFKEEEEEKKDEKPKGKTPGKIQTKFVHHKVPVVAPTKPNKTVQQQQSPPKKKDIKGATRSLTLIQKRAYLVKSKAPKVKEVLLKKRKL